MCAFLSGILCWRLTFSHFFFRFSLILNVLHVMATFSDDVAAVINSGPRIFIFRLLPTCGSLLSPLVKELMSTGSCFMRCMRSLLFSSRHLLSRSFMIPPRLLFLFPFFSYILISLSPFPHSQRQHRLAAMRRHPRCLAGYHVMSPLLLSCQL